MLFSAVFFASIGMLLDIRFVIDRWLLVAGSQSPP
jgi:Kef-type K+ transport system membrane component KefB